MIQIRHWLLAATIAALLVGGPALSAHAKTTTQHGNALATYNVKKYKNLFKIS
ncbi:hypothetical protein [Levilactobacillus brevis]|uniref:hypothetical protein n=1 Tax=Levilactobacillus brevis TaxID=1580 RepID=UPI00159BDE82|nr:hypothetical protein [Levilactobacillus brevis]